MDKENPYLNVYLGPLKQPWIAYCKNLGKKPGAALKEEIEHQLEKSSEVSPFQQTKEIPDDVEKQRFEILLTPSEKAALEKRARLERCSQRRWVIDAIRASLTKEPQLSMTEIDVLGESNYQLLAIGRNLNQIAKAMNEGRRDSITMESIQQLFQIIDAHTESVSRALRASLERWNIE